MSTAASPASTDVLAGLHGEAASDEIAALLISRYADDCRVGLDCIVSAVAPDTWILAVRHDAELELTLVQGEHRLAHGRLELPVPHEGFYWKSWHPQAAASSSLGRDLFGITARFEYWGGAGAGLLGSRNDVVYLVARDGDSVRFLLGAHTQEWGHDYTDCADDDDACFADSEQHEWRGPRLLLNATSGTHPRFELSRDGQSISSEWNPTTSHYEPPLLQLL